MTNWNSWNFLVPQFSFLQFSVWKFSVLEFCFTENTWIHLNFLGGGNEVCEIPSTSEVQTLHSTPASERRVRLGGIIEVRRERFYNLSQVIKMNHSSIAIL